MIMRLRSGSSTPASRSRKRSSASTWIRLTPSSSHRLDHLLGLVLAHQPVVDEHAGELVADRAVDERRGGRRVDAAREPADHAGVADLRADPLDLLVDHRGRRPVRLAAGDLAQEAVEDLLAVGRVDDLGVELDPVEAALGVLERGDRRAGAGGERRRSPAGGSKTESRWLIQHCCSARQAGEQPAAVAGEGQLGAAELARLGALDPAAELERPSPASRNRCRAPGSRARAARGAASERPPSRPRPGRRRAPAPPARARGSRRASRSCGSSSA